MKQVATWNLGVNCRGVGANHTVPMTCVSNLDSNEEIFVQLVQEFRLMNMQWERILVQIQDRNTFLFDRVDRGWEMNLNKNGWEPLDLINGYFDNGVIIGFVDDEGNLFNIGRELATIVKISQMGHPLATTGPDHDGDVEFELRKHHTYQMVGFI